VRAHMVLARQHGAEIHDSEPVTAWNASARSVEVRTARDTYSADRLVITAGPWAGQLLSRAGHPLTVMRQVLLWFGVNDPTRFRRDQFPIYLVEVPEGCFYGLPMIDPTGIKLARHYGAAELDDPAKIQCDVTDNDERPVREFLTRHIRDVQGPRTRSAVCIYTLTPDRHFILDQHPEFPNVAIAAGFSGHGFKFAPVVGEIMADLAMNGRTDLPIGMFGLGRFG
jgi:sarcosine oxidase